MASTETLQIDLREPNAGDKPAFARLLANQPPDTPNFLMGYEQGQSLDMYIAKLKALQGKENLPRGFVPATFLFAFDKANRDIVGRASIRHELNEHLAREGGHIGYAVLPEFRNRGVATQILSKAIDLARNQLHLTDILVTCDEDNHASRRVIERNGGVYASSVDVDNGTPKRHYWFRLPTER